MSEVKAKPNKSAPAPEKQMPNNVVSLQASKCVAEGCKTKPARAGFCDEHYTWFKEGLLTIDGYHAKDFDKKYHAWQLRKQKAA
jgi:hypothetical protein